MGETKKECVLCPRNCRISRSEGESLGICGETETIRIARAALHMWEEPCLSGTKGSGTVFFTGCTLRCVYCQNHLLSTGEVGKEISIHRLSEIFMELQEKGAHNINLVTPTHFVPQIVTALGEAKKWGLKIPIVYNTSGYECVGTLKKLEGLVDIYLPDFKYLDSEHAKKYSKAADYPQVVKLAIEEMVRQQGSPVFDENGMMQAGVIVRHLLLPGCLMDGKKVIQYLYQTYGEKIFFSLMNQYTPLEFLDKEKYPELDKKVSDFSYKRLIDYAIELGISQAFIQEGETAEESFIPSFLLEGV